MGKGCLSALLMIFAAGFALWAGFLYIINLPAYHAHAFRWGTIAPYLIVSVLLAIVSIRLAFPNR
jgi:hypothetical protein